MIFHSQSFPRQALLRWILGSTLLVGFPLSAMSQDAGIDLISLATSQAAMMNQANEDLVRISVSRLQRILRLQRAKQKTGKFKERWLRFAEAPALTRCTLKGSLITTRRITASIRSRTLGQFNLQDQIVYADCNGMSGSVMVTAEGLFDGKRVARTIEQQSKLSYTSSSLGISSIESNLIQKRLNLSDYDDLVTGSFEIQAEDGSITCSWQNADSANLSVLAQGCIAQSLGGITGGSDPQT